MAENDGRAGGRLTGRIALITGASRGIGRAVAVRFAREGAHVVALGRTVGALEELDDRIGAIGAKCTLVPMDLTLHEKIDALGASLYERFGRLDILVANAAQLGELAPVGHIDPQMWDHVFAINVTANFRLIRSLDRILRLSPQGRAIFVTSGAARGERPYWGLYGATKAALEAMVRSYAGETRRSTLRVNILDPGPIRTGMRAAAYPGEDPETLPAPDAITNHFVALADADCARHGDVVRIDRHRTRPSTAADVTVPPTA